MHNPVTVTNSQHLPGSFLNMSCRALPEEITSYDLLKTFAVVVMVADHIGYYFFADDVWWRAAGRIGFPVWFFLVGHSTGRDLPTRLIASAFILETVNFVVGLPMLPLSALFTIIAIRVVLDPLMRFALQSRARLWTISAALAAIAIPSGAFLEYGTLGLITAMFGYFVRHSRVINDDKLVFRFMIFAVLVFVSWQQFLFDFPPDGFTFMALATAAVHCMLLQFKARTYPDWTARCPRIVAATIRLCGRRTLEIYVVHLVLFGVLAVLLGMPNFGWFQLNIGLPSLGL